MTAGTRGLKVVILDDETTVEAAIASKLPKSVSKASTPIKPDEITSVVKELGSRAGAVRLSKKHVEKPLTLDTAGLFIVDYDLVKATNEDYLTGETVAYLARCYSRCGVIVALNQFHRQPTFDLTLRPQIDSFAEINIAADDLKNAGLWDPAPWKGYRPWSWPVLTDLVQLISRRIQDVAKADPKMRVVDFLEFPTSVVERLPTTVLELLGSHTSKADAATLSDVLRSPELGLRGREAAERKPQPAQDSRIIAARLSAWLNFVLSPQDVLVELRIDRSTKSFSIPQCISWGAASCPAWPVDASTPFQLLACVVFALYGKVDGMRTLRKAYGKQLDHLMAKMHFMFPRQTSTPTAVVKKARKKVGQR
jgi:hypothetical protein